MNSYLRFCSTLVLVIKREEILKRKPESLIVFFFFRRNKNLQNQYTHDYFLNEREDEKASTYLFCRLLCSPVTIQLPNFDEGV